MNSGTSSLAPAARVLDAGNDVARVLFVLSPREREIFLPDRCLEAPDGRLHAFIDLERASHEEWARLLREFRPTVLVTAWSAKALPADWVESDSFSVRYVCNITGSLSKVMTPRLYERGVRATNWGSLVSPSVAEHALLLVMALLRGLPRWREAIAEGGWTLDTVQRLQTRSLRGRRVAVHGFGGIAREIVALLAPFRPAEIRVYSHGVPASFITEHGARPCANLEELFSGAEVLIECESLSEHTRHSVDARLLSLLPNDAVFVNVGRAEVVDESALLGEAASGRLRVGVDVFHREPVSADYPLLHAPGVLVSPHIAGPTADVYRLCGDQALENLRRYLDGGRLTGEVTLTAFERMT